MYVLCVCARVLSCVSFGLVGMMDCCCCLKMSPLNAYTTLLCVRTYLFVLICLIVDALFVLFCVCLLFCVHMCMVSLCVFPFVFVCVCFVCMCLCVVLCVFWIGWNDGLLLMVENVSG